MRSRLEQFFVHEWQRRSGWQILLRPVSWIFAAIVGIRRALFKTGILDLYQPPVPVLVVGNLTVGGTGKTPVVLALANYLHRTEQYPGIVTRGYAPGQHQDSPTAVQPMMPQDAAKDREPAAGDEARLLANRSGVPVYAGSRRAATVATLLSDHADIRVVVSDDGLQHYALARDIEITVVDGLRGFGNGLMVPAGPLREPVSRLRMVDCIVLNQTGINASRLGKSLVPSDLACLLDTIGTPIFEMTYCNEVFVKLLGAGKYDRGAMLAMSRQKRIAAVAGIGNPERFFLHLEQLGLTLSSKHVFDDHHAFTKTDFAGIGADIVLMTEKDAVKCDDCADDRMWAMQIDALLPDAFYQFIQKKIDHVSRSKVA